MTRANRILGEGGLIGEARARWRELELRVWLFEKGIIFSIISWELHLNITKEIIEQKP